MRYFYKENSFFTQEPSHECQIFSGGKGIFPNCIHSGFLGISDPNFSHKTGSNLRIFFVWIQFGLHNAFSLSYLDQNWDLNCFFLPYGYNMEIQFEKEDDFPSLKRGRI